MNDLIESLFKGSPDCYGDPFTCNHKTSKCLCCSKHKLCADIAVNMVHAASTDTLFVGIDHDVYAQAERVRSFLPRNFQIPKDPLQGFELGMAHAAYNRTKKFRCLVDNSERIDDSSVGANTPSEPANEGGIAKPEINPPKELDLDPVAELGIDLAPAREEDAISDTSAGKSEAVAPAFRKRTRIPLKKKYSEAETNALRERQLADLKWLYQTGKRNQIKEGMYAELFTSEAGIDLKLATQFVRTGGTPEQKLETLKLNDLEQIQMSYFQTKGLRDKLRYIEKSSIKIEEKLRQQAIRNRRFERDVVGFIQMWKANEIAGHLGKMAVGEVLGWMTGAPPLTKSTISKKLTRLKKRLA